MATPITSGTRARTATVLKGLRAEHSGPPGPGDALAAEHLRLLGAEGVGSSGGLISVGEGEFDTVSARSVWSGRSELRDETAVQAATGIMAVHGRRFGAPRGLAVDYVAATTGILTVQGLLAALLARARGGLTSQVEVSAERAGLLAVSQYLAASGAEEDEAAEPGPGGPPFTSADGTVFELETLDPGAWAAFWRALDAPEEATRRGWRPFQFRYATACAPFPNALHDVTRARTWDTVRSAADTSGAEVCRIRTLAERAAEHDGLGPWAMTTYDASCPLGAVPPTGMPLSGITVLEAGRRIQAPLTAHLLRLLGADVVRVEPPAGDPLRGMPPTCSGVSARWLALNRGKEAVEVDIKSASGRAQLCDLAAGADVFLHNWAPGKAAQLGLEREDLAVGNPGLVYAHTSGWADRLPDAPMGTDFMVQARTGVGEVVWPAGEPPVPSLMTLLDVLGGLLGAEAVLAGLLLRERTGRGIRTDSSLLGAADVLTAPARASIARGQEHRSAAGFRYPTRTADGWIAAPDHRGLPYDVRELPTTRALELLREHGVVATPVVTDLSALLSSDAVTHDAHGAPAVPDPWSFR
ncbi:CoA transferase [Streptomyces sp. Z26]|uniref:CoA transferase n=1 Tax=Streptomyces sp. Z26 TaxID=2500177 RepID=UPI000EF148B6|nr:CoA transferase [Streptomyces sp. Z26]RLL67619.1 CoA transferase [Streptomyces sp. Z26]